MVICGYVKSQMLVRRVRKDISVVSEAAVCVEHSKLVVLEGSIKLKILPFVNDP